MKKQTLLLINGAEARGVAQGLLNQTLFELAKTELQPHYHVLETTIAEGYQVSDEQAKFKQADIIIFQYPVFWFSVPGVFKAYLDEVYEHGVFFTGSDRYGEGGLLAGKRYLLSTTWNAPSDVFMNQDTFFNGRAMDEVLLGMHKAQQYVGMTQLKSFGAFDVVSNPQLDHQRTAWRQHLQTELVSLEPSEAVA
jgi:NADPH dehydrogenase (quinone)